MYSLPSPRRPPFDTTPSVAELLASADRWRVKEDHCIAQFYSAYRQDRVTVSRAEVDAFDERLYPAMHAMASSLIQGLTGPDVRLLLQHWRAPLAVTDIFSATHYIECVKDFIFDTRDDVLIDALVYYTGTTSVVTADGQQTEVAFINRQISRFVTAPITWMDDTFPGWRERHATAAALGYTGKELAAYVCSTPAPAPTNTLDGLAFG